MRLVLLGLTAVGFGITLVLAAVAFLLSDLVSALTNYDGNRNGWLVALAVLGGLAVAGVGLAMAYTAAMSGESASATREE